MKGLKQQLAQAKVDTIRVKLLVSLARGSLQLGYADSLLMYSQQALAVAQKSNYTEGVSDAYWLMIWAYRQLGRYPEALQTAFHNLHLAEQTKDSLAVWIALRHMMFVFNDLQEYHTTLRYARRSRKLVPSLQSKDEKAVQRYALSGYMNFMSHAFEELNQLDSALCYKRRAYKMAHAIRDNQLVALTTDNLVRHFSKTAVDDSTVYYARLCIEYVKRTGFRLDLAANAQLALARVYRRRNQLDSALHYARSSLAISRRMKRLAAQVEATSLLHALYANQTPKDSAYTYFVLKTTLQDSLVNLEKIKQTESIKYQEALRQQQLGQERREAQQRYTRRITTYCLLGGFVLLLSIGFSLYRIRQIRHESQLKFSFTKRIHQTEMRVLRAQMNPHFFFNCLNSINRYIVKSDPKTASHYLTKFARLMRLTLDNSASESISLEKEIQTLQLYLDMESMRFDNAFAYAIEVAEEIQPDALTIPSMLLQPYIENAIWHGLLHKKNGGHVWLRFRQPTEDLLTVEIEDNGIGRQKAKELKSKETVSSKSYGMQISQDRLFLIQEVYGLQATVEVKDLQDGQGNGSGTKVLVQLPAQAS
ncbi:sensor histidine kinase [Hymenobacter volaticus]|uniref:Histidine kinase n=1 Tax=Hymenobacter volaticus TaxID=2932254 RepID=A0ABY4GG10_9BACT|nr:histidine kinase [Hymenobacter volaticus]UOQ69249.1 histidine kinase [Hymenobacter volaticus]